MTVFFDSANAVCAEVAAAFDFFADGNIEPLEAVLSGGRADFADDQLGFVVPAEPPETLAEFLERTTLRADYFFAVLVTTATSRSPRKFAAAIDRAGIRLSYLNFAAEDDPPRKRADNAIRFRSDVGLLVERVHEIPLKARVASLVSSILGGKGAKPAPSDDDADDSDAGYANADYPPDDYADAGNGDADAGAGAPPDATPENAPPDGE